LQVAGGQGTIALELLSQLPAGQLDAVFVPVGGGGLISGIASVRTAPSGLFNIICCLFSFLAMESESWHRPRIMQVKAGVASTDLPLE